MKVSHLLGNILSIHIIGRLPASIQKKITRIIFYITKHALSRYLIQPYCYLMYEDKNYIDSFTPASGNNYLNFQDFFTRKYKILPYGSKENMWPCDGMLCEYSQISKISNSNVKGNNISVEKIFGKVSKKIPETHYYSNIFLHNKDYHYIHAPADGVITRIEHISGELIMLRPWFYNKSPSYPAFRNERVNVDITTVDGNIWYLSIVGGLGVGTITMSRKCKEGNKIYVGQELGKFSLGSTCCIAAPVATHKKTGNTVSIHEGY